MLNLFLKILEVRRNTKVLSVFDCEQVSMSDLGRKLQPKIARLFRGSLAIRQVDAGSDNACEQELVALSNAFYDVERFGIHFVASPRHADMLFVTGPVTRNMAEAVRRAYEATPHPKFVVAVGDDAIDGGIFKDSYAVVGGVSAVIPVDYVIPGDLPSPKTILCHLLHMLDLLESRPPKTTKTK
ncbi:MAG: NADH-quinone oxidoreductase subunit B family protein [Patescibacteria group bacterium]